MILRVISEKLVVFFFGARFGPLLKREHPRPASASQHLELGCQKPCPGDGGRPSRGAVREVVTGALSFNGQRCTGLKPQSQDLGDRIRDGASSPYLNSIDLSGASPVFHRKNTGAQTL